MACATVDPQIESFDPTPLIPYVESLGVTYHFLSQPIVEMAKTKLQVRVHANGDDDDDDDVTIVFVRIIKSLW